MSTFDRGVYRGVYRENKFKPINSTTLEDYGLVLVAELVAAFSPTFDNIRAL